MSPIRGRAALVVCAALAATVSGVSQIRSARAELLWSGDANRPKNEVFKSTGSAGNCGEPSGLTTTNDPERGQVWLYHKPAESNRCENHGIKVDGSSFVFENDKTYYLGWWSKLSSTTNNNANFQWKSYGEGHEQNFPVVLKMQNGEMTLMQRQPDNSETILWRKRISANEWNHFALGLHLSNQLRGGWIEFWFNGVQQRLIPGGTRYACRLFDSGNHNCPKWGVYGGRGTEMTNRVDDLRVGTTLADVAMRPVPGSMPPPVPRPEPPSRPAPGPAPGPRPGALSFEAEALEVIHSGTGTSVQMDPMTSGGQWVALDAENAGSWMEFTLPDVPPGDYELHVTHKTNSNRGQLLSRIDGLQIGGILDQYAADSTYETAVMGTAGLANGGDRKVRLVVVGKRDDSQGFVLSADRLALVPTSEPVPRAREVDLSPVEDVVGYGCSLGSASPARGGQRGWPWTAIVGLGLLLALRRRRVARSATS